MARHTTTTSHDPRPASKASTIGTLVILLAVVAILATCRTMYPAETCSMFGIPPDLDLITATEWMLFRILVLISFLWVLYEVLKKKIGL